MTESEEKYLLAPLRTFTHDTGYNLERLPTTDQQVQSAIIQMYPDQLTSASLWGIYSCRRLRGESILDAWQATLELLPLNGVSLDNYTKIPVERR